jgi:hypothetical protein
MGEPKERPILMNAAMVRAVLAGRKTVTRRVMRTNHVGYSAFYRWDGAPFRRAMMRCLNETTPCTSVFCEDNRFGVPGDRLWVRETHAIVPASAYRCSREEDGSPVPHRVSPDGTEWAIFREGWTRSPPCRWRPSIHMPRWASRIDLEITGVRVERLLDLTDQDALAEGISPVTFIPDDGFPPSIGYMAGPDDGRSTLTPTAREAFARLWDSINGAGAADANPWVWVVAFSRVERAARAA